MAIAPLLDTEAADWSPDLYGASWPRPAPLLLLPDHDDAGHDEAGYDDGYGDGYGAEDLTLAPLVPLAPAPHGLRTGLDVRRRRAVRAATRRRRRAVVLATLAAGLICGLALPLSALGGSAARPGRPNGTGATAGGTVYVARPGDTLWSIANRFDDGGNARPLARALARETGSAVVVPGEHIAIP
jgi:nucleoid-associated protein YgaU